MNKPYSNALPHYFYRDPAQVIEARQLNALGCRLCVSYQPTMGRGVCQDVRNTLQHGVPNVGHRCKYFNERR